SESEDALPPELAFAFDAEDRHAPVPRVREPDRPVGLDAHIVRAVQLLALVVRRKDLAARVLAVGGHAHERARRVLADDQPAVGVERHPVALVARAEHLLDATGLVPAPPRVAGHVREEQELLLRVPDRPLGEGEAGAEPLHLDVLVDEARELVRPHVNAHALLPSLASKDGPNLPCSGSGSGSSPTPRLVSRRPTARSRARAS